MEVPKLSDVIADSLTIDQGDVDKTPFLEGELAKDFWRWYYGTYHPKEYAEYCKQLNIMTQEQYERAVNIKVELSTAKATLRNLESDEAAITVLVFDNELRDEEPYSVMINRDKNINIKYGLTDYLNRRIAELEKEFEEL